MDLKVGLLVKVEWGWVELLLGLSCSWGWVWVLRDLWSRLWDLVGIWLGLVLLIFEYTSNTCVKYNDFFNKT